MEQNPTLPNTREHFIGRKWMVDELQSRLTENRNQENPKVKSFRGTIVRIKFSDCCFWRYNVFTLLRFKSWSDSHHLVRVLDRTEPALGQASDLEREWSRGVSQRQIRILLPKEDASRQEKHKVCCFSNPLFCITGYNECHQSSKRSIC